MKLHTATLEAELLHKAKLEDDFNRDLDIAFGKLTRETELERKLKEEERKLKEEAILQKEEAIKLLTEFNAKTQEFAVVSVVGRYRTGKSYLLNRVLLNQSNGF